MNVSVVSCDVDVGFEMCPKHAIELQLADSNSAQLLILHGLATRRKAQTTTIRTTTTVVVGSPTTKYQPVLGGQSVCAFCIGGWYFYCIFFLFYLLCLLFFAMAMATTASVVIANILVATPAPRPFCTLPRLPPRSVWLMAGSDDEISRQRSRHWNYKYNLCTRQRMHDINVARVVRIVQWIYIYMYTWVVRENLLNG